jgi:hypothetical protein
MEKFDLPELRDTSIATVMLDNFPQIPSRPCKSLEMQISRRFSQEIDPAKSLRN